MEASTMNKETSDIVTSSIKRLVSGRSIPLVMVTDKTFCPEGCDILWQYLALKIFSLH